MVQFFRSRARRAKVEVARSTYDPATRHNSGYWKERRAAKKLRGECFSCLNPARPGLTRCDDCSLRGRLYRLGLNEEESVKAINAVEAFDGHCQCCGTAEPKGNGWCLDHDHLTGKFRGILCQNCNSLLGAAKDCVTILLKAINYVRWPR